MACDNKLIEQARKDVDSMTEDEFMAALLLNNRYPATEPVMAALVGRAYRELKGVCPDYCTKEDVVEESQEDTPPDLKTLLESTKQDKEHERFVKESVVRSDPEWCMQKYPEFMMFYNLPWVEENAPDYLFEQVPEYVANKYPEDTAEKHTKWMLENRFDYMAQDHPEKVYENIKYRHTLTDRNPEWMFANHPEEAIKMRPKWYTQRFPEEAFQIDPEGVVFYNPKWVLDNRFEWVIVNHFRSLKRTHLGLLREYWEKLPAIYKDQLND